MSVIGKHLALAIILFMYVVATYRAYACDSGTLWVYSGAWAVRSNADTVYTYTQEYATGPDSEYTRLAISQDDYFNGQSTGSQLIGTADPGGTAWTWRNTSVDLWGFGQYTVTSLAAAYDTCTGRVYPPYDIGLIDGKSSASLYVYQPRIIGSSGGLSTFPMDRFPTSTVLTADTGGAPENPYWFSSDPNTSEVSFPSGGSSITVIARKDVPLVCGHLDSVQFRVGNLTSPSVAFIVNGLKQDFVKAEDISKDIGICGPNFTNCRFDFGYESQIFWHVYDICNRELTPSSMALQLHEEFPQGFQPQYSGENWNTPIANQWCVVAPAEGSTDYPANWVDHVGQVCRENTCTPMPTSPGNPVGNIRIYQGLQEIWAGYVSTNPGTCLDGNAFTGDPAYDVNDQKIWSGTQIHFQDHGGVTQP